MTWTSLTRLTHGLLWITQWFSWREIINYSSFFLWLTLSLFLSLSTVTGTSCTPSSQWSMSMTLHVCIFYCHLAAWWFSLSRSFASLFALVSSCPALEIVLKKQASNCKCAISLHLHRSSVSCWRERLLRCNFLSFFISIHCARVTSESHLKVNYNVQQTATFDLWILYNSLVSCANFICHLYTRTHACLCVLMCERKRWTVHTLSHSHTHPHRWFVSLSHKSDPHDVQSMKLLLHWVSSVLSNGKSDTLERVNRPLVWLILRIALSPSVNDLMTLPVYCGKGGQVTLASLQRSARRAGTAGAQRERERVSSTTSLFAISFYWSN